MAATYYPLEMENSPDYGNTCITFTLKERNEAQAKNPSGGGTKSIPSNAKSGMPIGGFEDLIGGIINPITTFIKENPFERYLGSKKGSLTKPSTKIVEDIIMYVPGDVGTSYKSKWEEQNAPEAGAAWQAAGGAGGGVLSTAWEAAKAGVGAGAVQAAGGGSGGITDFFMSQTGTAPNPFKQLYFKDMEFRTHTFTFHLYAKSLAESNNIRRIINLFKFNLHPGVSNAASFLYDYPGWFDIKYYVNGVKNPYMHNFKKTILESMDVRYSPEGIYVTHEDGSPTHVQLQLNFKELEILMKRDFQNEADSC